MVCYLRGAAAGAPSLLHHQLSSPGWQSWQAKRGYSQAGKGREKQAGKKGFQAAG